MVTLLISPSDIPNLTNFDGNIDVDNLKPHIYAAQTTEIRRILGDPLYNKLMTDYNTGSLTGQYLYIHETYIIDMLSYLACAIYCTFGGYKISQEGLFISAPDKTTPIARADIDGLESRFKQLATNVETSFVAYMKTINIPEYLITSDTPQPNAAFPWLNASI